MIFCGVQLHIDIIYDKNIHCFYTFPLNVKNIVNGRELGAHFCRE